MNFTVKIKENKKRDKYLDLARELKLPWNMSVMVIPIVIGELRTVSNSLDRRLEEWYVSGIIENVRTTRIIEMSRNTEESPKETCRHSDSSERPPTDAGVINS